MISEVQNILRGSVLSTVQYDTSRKLIGVSTANLVPAANGVAPLSKQGAFQVPEKTETVEKPVEKEEVQTVQTPKRGRPSKSATTANVEKPTKQEPLDLDFDDAF